jgi:parvulin-like peptidyl-prolyl isomerase
MNVSILSNSLLMSGCSSSWRGGAAAGSPSVHAPFDSMRHAKLKFWICFGVLLPVICLSSGCKSEMPEKESVAVVEDEKIYFDEFDRGFKKQLNLMKMSAGYNEAQISKLKREYLNEMIDEKLMLRRARQAGIVVSDREVEKKIGEIKADYPGDGFNGLFKEPGQLQAWREELKKRMIFEKLIGREVNINISVSDEEARAYFDNHPNAWAAEDSVRVSQIVLPDREKAEETLRRLKKGEDFAALAKELSAGPEGAKGGDLGLFTKGVLPEHFDRVIFSLEAGKFSGIVETPYGFHIFKVGERVKKRKADYADVSLKIKETLKREKEEKAYELWLANLRSKASITLNQAALDRAGRKQ